MRGLPVLVLLVSSLLLAGCSGGGSDGDGETPTGQDHLIAMHNAKYEPSTITVAKGDTLTFEAHDVTHSAKTTDNSYDAGDIPAGGEKTITMDKSGTHVFKCRFHSAMSLTVTVNP